MPKSSAMNKVIQRTLTNQYRRSSLARSGTNRPARAVQFNGGAAASMAGSPISVLGSNAPGGSTIAVQNVGRLANAVYVPSTASSIVHNAVSFVGGTGGPSGGGSSTLAGLTDVNLTSLLNGHLLSYNSALSKWVNVAPSVITGLSAGLGIDITGGVVSVKRKASGGLDADIDGLFVMRQANSGLLLGPTGLAVGAGNGILVAGTTVALNPATTIRWTGLHTFALDPQLEVNLDFVGAVNHEITATNTLAIKPLVDLRLDPGGVVAYADSQKSRTDTFQDSVTGIIGFELSDWSAIEFPPGVLGGNSMGLKLNYLKVDNLFARKFTADEVRVQRGEWMLTRSFGIVEQDFNVPAVGSTVDVWFEEAAGLDGAKLFLKDNWIEFKTIDLGTGLVIQTIFYQIVDADGAGNIDYIQRLPQAGEKVARQQWRLRRMSGGFTGMVTKKGETGADIGQPRHEEIRGSGIFIPDQGVIFATSLFDADGPFIQTQTFDHVTANVPIFKNRTRMGNLKGVVDYQGETYGFAAGDDLSKLPSAGFRGFAVDINNGARFFNTDLYLYESNIIAATLTHLNGLNFLNDTTQFAHDTRVIGWYDNLADIGTAFATAKIGSWGNVNDRQLHLNSFSLDRSAIFLSAEGDGGADRANIAVQAGGWNSVLGGYISLQAHYVTHVTGDDVPRFRIGGDSGAKAKSYLHVWANDTAVNDTAGITIEQDGAGDPTFHWALGTLQGGRQYVAGIDNDDGDKWKLSIGHTLGINDVIIVNPANGQVTIPGFNGTGTPIPVDITAGDGITIAAGNIISVNTSVVRNTRSVGTDGTMTGGGFLDHNLVLGVNTANVGGTLLINAGGGLTQNRPNLGAALTLDIGATDASIVVGLDGISVNRAFSYTWTAASVHVFNATPTINANLVFGGNRAIGSDGNITLSPAGVLYLMPAGNVWIDPGTGASMVLADYNIFRSPSPDDSPTKISGFQIDQRGASNLDVPIPVNEWQLTITAVKVQELIARSFVSDETRIQRGQNYIAPGFGVVAEDFLVPAIGSNVPVTFENAVSDPTALIFKDGDYLLLDVVDLASGLVLMSIWFQTLSHAPPNQTYKNQRWTLKHLAGGTLNRVIKKGNTALDAGVIGSGWIHLAAVAKNAPFIDVGEFTSVVSSIPQFTSRTRMGRLAGIADYPDDSNTWGFATGNNLKLTPQQGFSGITSDAVHGTRLFNTDIAMYEGGVNTVTLNAERGLDLLIDEAWASNKLSMIAWSKTLDPVTNTQVEMSAYQVAAGTNQFDVLNQAVGGSGVAISRLLTLGLTGGEQIWTNLEVSSEGQGYIYAAADVTYTRRQLGVGFGKNFYYDGPAGLPDATLHVWDQGYITPYSYDGILIEGQLGDVALRWKHSLGNHMFTAGIDQSDGYKWKLSVGDQLGAPYDFIIVDPATGKVTINGLTGGSVSTGLVAGQGIALAGPIISVSPSVVQTDVGVYTGAGSGLQGGGELETSLFLSIDLDPASGLSLTLSGLRIDPSTAGAGLAISAGIMSVNPLLAGDGLAYAAGVMSVGAGADIVLSANSIAVGPNVVRDTIQVIGGAGLSNGGALSGNVTLNVQTGSGIAIVSDAVAVDATVARNTWAVNAGAGMTGGGNLALAGITLNVIAGDATLTVGVDSLIVNQSFAFAWTGVQTWSQAATFNGVPTFNSAPQINANLAFIGGERSITTTGGNNLNLAPAGDLVLAPAGLDVLPGGSGITDFGDYNRKWGGIYASELVVQNLVALNVMATIGGNVRVGPTSTLIADFLIGATSIDLKHTFASGTYMVMESVIGVTIKREVIKLGAPSTITGGFRFTVTRSLAGGGSPADWFVGDAIFSLGAVQFDGFIDLASVKTIKDSIGPTITVYGRTAATNWSDITPRVAMGNLESFAGIAAKRFGFAAGNDLTLGPSNGLSGFTVTSDQGMKLYNTAIELYSGSNKVVTLNKTTGLSFEIPPIDSYDWYERYVTWYSDLNVIYPPTHPDAYIGMYRDSVSMNQGLALNVNGMGGSGYNGLINLAISSMYNAAQHNSSVTVFKEGIKFGVGPQSAGIAGWITSEGNFGFGGPTSSWKPSTRTHFYENNTNTGLTEGLLLDQLGGGDSALHFQVVAQSYSIGIDNSDGDALKIDRGGLLGGSTIMRIPAVADEIQVYENWRVVNAGFISSNHANGHTHRDFMIPGFYVNSTRLNLIAFNLSGFTGVTIRVSYSQFNTGVGVDEPIMGMGVLTLTKDGGSGWIVNNTQAIGTQHISLVAQFSGGRTLIYLNRVSGTGLRPETSFRCAYVEVIGLVNTIVINPTTI